MSFPKILPLLFLKSEIFPCISLNYIFTALITNNYLQATAILIRHRIRFVMHIFKKGFWSAICFIFISNIYNIIYIPLKK